MKFSVSLTFNFDIIISSRGCQCPISRSDKTFTYLSNGRLDIERQAGRGGVRSLNDCHLLMTARVAPAHDGCSCLNIYFSKKEKSLNVLENKEKFD